MKAVVLAGVFLVLVLMASVITPVYCSQIGLEKDRVLLYKYARMSTSDQAQYTGDVLYQILTYGQDSLVFLINGTSDSLKCTIRYSGGFPVYTNALEALLYLPPECISQSLMGNLDWISNVEMQTSIAVQTQTSQTLNYTVEAGTFQCINITMALAGLDYGTLSMAYDLNSGILVYEKWIPSGGDVIVQWLASAEYLQGPQQGTLAIIASLALSATTIATPTAIALYQTRKRIGQRRRKSQESLGSPESQVSIESQETPAVPTLRSGFPKKLVYIAIVGALLNLVAVFIPWSQTLSTPTYLPLSLTPLLAQSAWLLPSISSYLIISLAAYSAAIIAWLSIAMHIYGKKKLTPQIAAIVSSVLAFVSAAIFLQAAGLSLSWGLLITVIGSVFTLASVSAANLHITIELEPEEPEKSQEHAESDESEETSDGTEENKP